MPASVQSIEKKNNEYKKIVADNDGRKYFDIIASREKEDPGVHDREYKAAMDVGMSNADDFMSKALNHNHPDHAAALSAFKDKYGGDRSNVDEDFINKAVNLLGAKRNEKENTAYTNKLFSMFKVSTAEDQGYLNKFKDYMRNKWAAVGYKDDADYIDDFFEVHPMSTKPGTNTLPVAYNTYKPLQHQKKPGIQIQPN